MDDNTIQKPQKKKLKIIIIIVILLALIIAAVVSIIIITNNASSKKHLLENDTDVIEYLEREYKDEIFEIVSKESNRWLVRSESGFTFYVEETTDKNGEIAVKDGFVKAAIDDAIEFFESSYIDAKVNYDNYNLSLYDKDGALLDLSTISDRAKIDIVLLCINITSYPQFKNADGIYRAVMTVFMNNADASNPLKCNKGDNTYDSLLY